MFNQFKSPTRMKSSENPLTMLAHASIPNHARSRDFHQISAHPVSYMISFRAGITGSGNADQQEITSGISLPTNITLAPRERDVLLWAANGKSAWETAILLELTENTVKFYIRKACSRLGAQNKTHAVAICIAHNLLRD